MIDERTRFQACLADFNRRGRPVGAKTRPMPAKEGPLWDEFLEWFAHQPLPAERRADLWRAFCAGVESASIPKRGVAT